MEFRMGECLKVEGGREGGREREEKKMVIISLL